MKSKTVLITGGSGFIGSKIIKELVLRNYNVIHVGSRPAKFTSSQVLFIKHDITGALLPEDLDGKVDAIIHLAGKNIFGRWTEKFKKEIYQSRIQSTKNIVDSVAKWKNKPSVFICASAFGYYGDKGDHLVDELSSKGDDFLSRVCFDWEAQARKIEKYGVRLVNIRTALVLGEKGILEVLMLPFKLGLGAWIGKGSAWFPWIYVDDLIFSYIFCLENEKVNGPVNVASPEFVRQKEFMKTFGKVLNRPVLLSVPTFFLKIRFGGLADSFNNCVKMSPKKIINAGFKFKYPNLSNALSSAVGKKKA